MNRWFTIAALMVLVLSVAHFLGGVPRVQTPVAPDNPVPDIGGITMIIWSVVSILLVINTAVLIGAALNKPWGRVGPAMIVGQVVGFAALFIYYGTGFVANQINPLIWVSVISVPIAIFLGHRLGRQTTPRRVA